MLEGVEARGKLTTTFVETPRTAMSNLPNLWLTKQVREDGGGEMPALLMLAVVSFLGRKLLSAHIGD